VVFNGGRLMIACVIGYGFGGGRDGEVWLGMGVDGDEGEVL
jgi:hypothetical protein